MAPRRTLTQQGDLLKLGGDTFTIKEELKKLGARFDGAQKCWFLSSSESVLKKLEFMGFILPSSFPTPSSLDSPESTTPTSDALADTDTLTVTQFTQRVEAIFQRHLAFDFWIVGEISSLKSSSGHVYFDLVEPEQERALQTGRAASIPCCLWAGKIRQLGDKFTGLPLAEGIKVKLKVHCDFRKEGARLNLIVDDLDPHYTLGDLALQRENIVRELKRRGLYDRQRMMARWPEFPMRIALLTAAGSRAQTDFFDELKLPHMSFQITLFDCHMQGEQVEGDISKALNEVSRNSSGFDCVVITRGGGSRLDLRWFDNLEVAKAIAYCPLPVLTAIGHFEDVSIADEVAAVAEKTPTGASRFLTQTVAQNFERQLARLERASTAVRGRLLREAKTLERTDLLLVQSAQRRLEREKAKNAEGERALRLVQRTAAQPLRLGYAVMRATNGKAMTADDFLTSELPGTVQIELHSPQKNALVSLEIQIAAVKQRVSTAGTSHPVEHPLSPQTKDHSQS
ncbi:MAG: exodeoxyribonuclease VII large subunit [Betaproteobacteria bacterium]|nr:exodeoxyribonuclease VII large subunit [Betaproteobacteria bacterium]